MAYELPNITDFDNYLLSRRYAEGSPTRRGAHVQKQQDVVKALPQLGFDGLPIHKEGMDGLGLTQEELMSASPYTNINQLEVPTLETPVAPVVATNSFESPASPYMNVDLNNMGLTNPVYTPPPVNPFATAPAVAPQYPQTANGYRNIGAVSNKGVSPALSNIVSGGKGHSIPTTKGSGTIVYRNKTPGYMFADGAKNWVAKNPGNIASKQKLLYGANGRMVAPYNGQDHADSSLLTYPNERAGFAAMHTLMSSKKYNTAFKENGKNYNGTLGSNFQRWQKGSMAGKLKGLKAAGVDSNKRYVDLTPAQQKAVRKVWTDAEGKWQGKYY